MIGNTSTISDLRLAIYRALEESSYQMVQDLALRLDSGTPATQAHVRGILHTEPEVFWPYEERWDLAIFHRFEARPHLFRGRGARVFDQDKFLDIVLTEALRLKGIPIDLVTLAEKYLMKIARSTGLRADEFPTRRWEILERLRPFLDMSEHFHVLRENGEEWVWAEPTWPEPRAVVQAPAFPLREDFLDRAAEYLEARRDQTVRLLEILEHALDIDANHPDFPSAFSLANAALSADTETFAQVQEQAWMLAAHLPADIEEIPARVAIPRWRNPQEEKIVEETDELPPESLAEAAEFVGEEEADATEVQFDENYLNEIPFVLPYHWRQSGVLKVNARERRLFPNRPARVRLEFEDRLTRQTFPVWLNNDTRYLYGLENWYAANLVPAGGVFYVQRAAGSKYSFKIWINEAQAHTFDGRQFFCEVDEDTYIEEDRLRDLEALRAKVEAAQATIKDVMCDLFESCPPGTALHYKQVWSQVHVIRPTTRHTVAAILSMFPCFYQTEPGSGRWLYVPALRDAPPSRRPPAPRPRPARPKEAARPAPRPPRSWLVPVHAASWDVLARPAEAGEKVFLVLWRGRSRVVKGDQLVFYNADSERLLAAVEVWRVPVRDAVSGQREVAVHPLLETFAPLPYADVAGALSVPQPEPDGFPVEITPEDMTLLLERLRPLVAPKPAELTLEELLKQARPKAEPTPPAPGEIIPHTYGPNPTIATFIARYGRPYDPKEPYEQTAFAYPVKAGRSGTIYNAHPYHTKVPPQGIEPYIEHYTEPGDIILDSFCGSGMTGVAALNLGRRVILNDLSPAATHIAYNYCNPVDVEALKQEFERIKAAIKEEFDWLYGTTCDRCGGPATIQYTIWSDVYRCANCGGEIVLWDAAVDPDSGKIWKTFACPECGVEWQRAQLTRLRSEPVLTNYKCQRCRPVQAAHLTTDSERSLIKTIDSQPIPYWYPEDPISPHREMMTMGPNKRGIKTTAGFYTRRNLRALARLWDESSKAPSERLTSALRFAFTAIALSHTTVMTRMILKGGRSPVLTSHMTGTLYTPALPVEKNGWEVFTRKFKNVVDCMKATTAFRLTDLVISTASATQLTDIPNSSVDYIFTDPPFGGNIYYSDCSLLWESWLQHYTDEQFEIHYNRIRKPEHGGKTMDDYEALMTMAFAEMHRVLKPGRWASVVFHNSEDRVWRAIQHGAEAAGFDLVNAMVFDKKQRSFKGVLGEKGLENVTNFDIVLNLHKKAEARPVAQSEAQDRIERLIVEAVDKHLRSGPAPDYRTSQYLHSLALRTLLNEKISIELTWEQLERILQRFFRHINCHWYLPKEAITLSGHGFLVRSETTAVAWLEHILAANPQTLSDLIPQWQIATLGAGSRIKRTVEELLEENFWKDEATGLWCVPTAAQRELLKRRRVKPQQLRLDLGIESGPQHELGLG